MWLVLGLAIRCQYSSSLPCLLSMELAILQNHINRNFRVASLATEILNVGLVMLMQASITSCMILVVRDLVLYQWGGSSSCPVICSLAL